MLRGEFLPGQQVTEEIRRGYRLDLLPQTVERVTVNACEQSARTPFSFHYYPTRLRRSPLRAGCELPANDKTLGFQLQQTALDLVLG